MRLAREAALVTAAWCMVPLLFVPDVVRSPTTRFWGSGGADVLGMIWTAWHVAFNLAGGRGLGLHTTLVAFPDGGSFWPATPVEMALLAPVTLAAGAVAAFNLLQVLHVGLAGGATYALVRRLTGSAGAGLALSPLVALGPVLLCSAHNGNVEVSQVYWLPLGALAAWEARERGGAARILLAGTALGLAVVGNVYVGVSTGVVVLAVLAGRAGTAARTAGVLAAGAALALPAMWVAGGLSTADAALVDRSAEMVLRMRLLEGAATLWGFLWPGAVLARGPGGQPSAYLNGWSPGLVALALAAWVVWHRRGRAEAALLGAVGASVLLALGPVLKPLDAPLSLGDRYFPLPYVLLDRLPPFDMLIELWRFAMVIPVASALLVAPWLAGRTRLGQGIVGALLLVEALAVNPGPAVWTVDAVPDEPMAALAEQLATDPGPVLHLPERQHQWPLYYQTLHHQTIGNSTEMPADPLIFATVGQRPWTLSELRQVARARGYRWLVLHTRDDVADVQPVALVARDLRAAGLVRWERGTLLLVDLAREGPWPRDAYTPAGAPTQGEP